MRAVLLAAALAVAILGSGCNGGGGTGGAVVLDGRPRFADDEGVVTSVSRAELTLDGRRSYDVSKRLQAFSTRTLAAVPLLGRSGQYVLVGVEGDTVVWLASVGAVLRVPGKPAVAYYIGDLEHAASGRATFADGTVLRLAPGVSSPGRGLVRAEIDVARHAVRTLVRV